MHGLRCPAVCGILPEQGRNPCPLHWQLDLYLLHHQGSPTYFSLALFTHLNSWFKVQNHAWGIFSYFVTCLAIFQWKLDIYNNIMLQLWKSDSSHLPRVAVAATSYCLAIDFSELILSSLYFFLCMANEVSNQFAYWSANDWIQISLNTWTKSSHLCWEAACVCLSMFQQYSVRWFTTLL